MAAWYRTSTPTELTAGLSDLALAPGSKEGFALLRRHGVITAVASITWSFAVEWFARRLGTDHTLGTRLSPSGIEHVWPEDKGAWLAALAARLGLAPDQVAAVGDSDGDRELLEAAALRFFVGSKPPALAGLVHLPGASLLEVAEQILARD